MKPLNEDDIHNLLSDLDPVEIPAGLAENIKAQIPTNLTLPSTNSAITPMPFQRRAWLPLAASLLALMGGGYLVHRISLDSPHPATVMEAVVEAPQPNHSLEDFSTVEKPAERGAPPETASELRRENAPQAEVPAIDDDARKDRRSVQNLGNIDLPPAKSKKVPAPSPPPPPLAESSPGARSEHPRLREERANEAVGEAEALQQQLADLVVTAEAPAHAGRARQQTEVQGASTAQPSPVEHKQRGRQELPKPPTPGYHPGTLAPVDRQLAEVDGASAIPLAAPSTGGTAEPNDAPYGDVFFEGYGTNPFIDTEDDPLSTFGLDVDTASYTVVRRYLNDGHLPPADAVRVEELVNYFDYGDAPPEEAEFALHAEGAPSPFATGDRYYLLRFNLRGRDVAAKDRPPAMLTFVVDVSGSMAEENRLGLVKRALGLLLDELRSDDRISLVVYGSRGRVVLEPTNDHQAIRRAISELRPEGATNAEEGLQLAYELAARHRRPGTIQRVILCSDGVANVGRTGAESILERVRSEAQKGIELTTVGFGMGNYNDVMMEQLADRGNGRYAYVDTLDEAHRIFVEDLTGTLMTLAAEARSQVEFNPEVVARYRLLGYENRDIADQRFRDDTVDAGEIGVGHTVTVLYEIKLRQDLPRRPGAGSQIATLRLRYGSVARGAMVELERTVTGSDFAQRWEKASPALRLTSLVAEFAEILKGTYWAREGDLETVFRQAQKVSAEFAGDRDVAEFVSLAGKAAEYKKRQ